jgi:predicted MFS family arabinose efflux permease
MTALHPVPFPKPAPPTTDRSAASPGRITARILSTVVFNLIVYFLIGLPLAVLPGLVHFTLGYSAALAGFLISLQYAATLVTRSLVGRLSDAKGPKWAVLMGLSFAAASGGCVLFAGAASAPLTILGWLALSRIWLGAAESGTGTGCITWGIGQTGPTHTAAVMSWNGIASYGGIALGAPVGVALYRHGGLATLGGVTMCLALAGLLPAAAKRATPIIAGARMGFALVFRRMLPYGACLALGSVGFGTIVAFITLFYASRHWSGAAYALSGFGVAFVLVRLCFANAIRRFGGFRTSIVSFTVEIAGLLTLWLASAPWLAVSGAVLTGLGLSLIFPAMAVEALKSVPQNNRGAAIGVYTVFLDVSLGATGPLAGLTIGNFGYASVYLSAACMAALAGLLSWRLLALSKGRAPQS